MSSSRPHSASLRLPAARRSALLGTSIAALSLLLGGLTDSSALAAGKVQTKRVQSIRCRGGSSSCTAVVGLAGGASNKKLRITLSDSDLKLVGVLAKPSYIRGAFELSRGSYSLGGSLYTVTLNAVQAIPRGATLTLRFAVPKTKHS
jgi:hypothetical protein